MVAAGLFNPITGKMLTKTWLADQLYPYLHSFYQQCEVELGHRFYFPTDLYRPFLTVEEQNDWMAKSEDPSIRPYIKKIYLTPHFSQCHNPFGGMVLNQCGFLAVDQFMMAVRQRLSAINSFENLHFDPTQLTVQPDRVGYGNDEAKAIVFCNGIRQIEMSYFSWLPVRPLMGEVLTIRLAETPEAIFNRGVYVVPAGPHYKVGATYRHSPPNEGNTPEGLGELTTKLKDLLAIPYEIIGEGWGIRPTTPDRKPILGSHFAFKNVITFNGLGTKGVSQAPYFANQLVQWLSGRGEIQPEVNIERFKALYSKSLV